MDRRKEVVMTMFDCFVGEEEMLQAVPTPCWATEVAQSVEMIGRNFWVTLRLTCANRGLV